MISICCQIKTLSGWTLQSAISILKYVSRMTSKFFNTHYLYCYNLASTSSSSIELILLVWPILPVAQKQIKVSTFHSKSLFGLLQNTYTGFLSLKIIWVLDEDLLLKFFPLPLSQFTVESINLATIVLYFLLLLDLMQNCFVDIHWYISKFHLMFSIPPQYTHTNLVQP